LWNKKGLVGIFRLFLVLVSLLILGFLTYSSLISAESVSQIWTTDADENPKIDFAPYTTVYIHGSDFLEKLMAIYFQMIMVVLSMSMGLMKG